MKRTVTLSFLLVAVLFVAVWSLPGIAHADDPAGADTAPATTSSVTAPTTAAGDPDTFFAVDVRNDAVLTLTSDAPATPAIITSFADDTFGGDFVNGDYTQLYVVDNTGDLFATIDTSDGTLTVIGELGEPVGGGTWSDAAWDDTTDTMFGSSAAATGATLYTIDLTTGTPTVIGSVTGLTVLIDLAVDPVTGNLYGIDTGTDSLYRIDKSTAAPTLIGALGYDANFAQGMDFDDADGILYWAAYQGAGVGPGSLRTIDITTGASTEIGIIGDGATILELDAFAWIGQATPTAVTLGSLNSMTDTLSHMVPGIVGLTVLGLLGMKVYSLSRRT